jgi:hypothetical protein
MALRKGKILSTFQQKYTSVGGKAVQNELKRIIALNRQLVTVEQQRLGIEKGLAAAHMGISRRQQSVMQAEQRTLEKLEAVRERVRRANVFRERIQQARLIQAPIQEGSETCLLEASYPRTNNSHKS